MKTTSDLLRYVREVVDAAVVKGVTDLTTLGSAVLPADKAEQFVIEVENATRLLSASRRVDLDTPKRDIDRITFNGRVLDAPADLEANNTNDAEPTTTTNQLSTVEVMGAVSVADATIEHNIEREGFEDTLLGIFGRGAGLDMEELFLHGDSASGDNYLALIDGWIKKGANAVTAGVEFDATDVEDMFEAMIAAVPEKYLDDLSNWNFYAPFAVTNAYRNALRARGTDLGDSAQTGNAGGGSTVPYKGAGVVTSAKVGSGNCVFANPDNLVYAIDRDVRIEAERFPRGRRTEWILTFTADCHFEDENAFCSASGFTG